MTKKQGNTETGVSDLIGTILIIILVIGLAAVIAAFLMPNLLHKSAYIASEVSASPITQPSGQQVEVISLLPKNGDPFYIIGQKKSPGGYPISVRALSPDGRNIGINCTDLTGNLYGKELYVYPANRPGSGPCDMCINDTRPTGSMRPMVNGVWTIQLVDEESHILVMSNSDGKITKGTTSLPKVGGMLGSNVYYANCSTLTPTPDSNAPTSTTLGPGNMSYRTFNGNQYMQYPDDPALDFNGDMGISLWFNPSDNSSWHQIIGKGRTTSSGSTAANEDDNYQVFQIGNQLLFEWNDVTTGLHYQAITPPTVQANQWNYLTVNVESGQLKIYNNGGASLPLVYYNNNYQGVPTMSTPPTVNLRPNDYNLYIGNQFQSGWPYSYTGSIGNMGLYDRPLTANEIQQNYQSYSA